MKYAVIGNPIDFTKSPLIFNFLFDELNIKSSYGKLLLKTADEFPFVFQQGYSGFSITAPFKQSIMPHLDFLSDEVKQIGSVNTVVLKEGKSFGYNTDCLGVVNALKDAGVSLQAKRCLVLGAGGAARAAIYALKKEGAQINVFNRTSEKAKALAQEFEVSHILEADIDEIIRNTDIIVDALPAGVSLLKNKELHKNIIVLDASYPKSVYEHSDIKCLIGGEKWLLHQAIPAFKLFTGLELDKTNYNQKALIDILIKS